MRLSVRTYQCEIFPGERNDVVYLITSAEDGAPIFEGLSHPRPALVVVDGVDWNRELSPWPAPKLFRRDEDFAGEAGTFLKCLTEEVIPSAEAALGFVPESRALAGYSLAGLFSVWAPCETDAFDRIASMSGSLWYDNFLEYQAAHPWKRRPVQVSLSLGDGEKKTRNQKMALVEERTQKFLQHLQNAGIPVRFHWESGGHFQDVNGKIIRGIEALY